MDYTADHTLDWVNQFAAWALPLPLMTPLVEDPYSWIKIETGQISSSTKYRAVHARLAQAINDGQIHPGTILTGVGSDTVGRALLDAGSRLGLKVELHVSAALSHFKRRRLAAAGARLILHPSAQCPGQLLDQVRWRSRRYGHWLLDPGDPESFNEAYESLGQELVIQIYRACRTAPRHFLCPVSSGKLIQTVGRRLKQAFPDVTTVGVILGADPAPCPDVADLLERRERGPRELRRNATSLGVGGTACYQLARERGWRNSVILAPG